MDVLIVLIAIATLAILLGPELRLRRWPATAGDAVRGRTLVEVLPGEGTKVPAGGGSGPPGATPFLVTKLITI